MSCISPASRGSTPARSLSTSNRKTPIRRWLPGPATRRRRRSRCRSAECRPVERTTSCSWSMPRRHFRKPPPPTTKRPRRRSNSPACVAVAGGFRAFGRHAQVYPGQSLSLSWTVTNNGGATATGPWNDEVYLASDAQGDNETLLGTFPDGSSLAAGASYTSTEQVALPADASGQAWLVVTADPNSAVLEPGTAASRTEIDTAPLNFASYTVTAADQRAGRQRRRADPVHRVRGGPGDGRSGARRAGRRLDHNRRHHPHDLGNDQLPKGISRPRSSPWRPKRVITNTRPACRAAPRRERGTIRDRGNVDRQPGCIQRSAGRAV